MRRFIMSFLVLAAATACADDPITPDPPEPGRPLADIIRTGGIDNTSAGGFLWGSFWPPAGWRFPHDIGEHDDLCWVQGRCPVGNQVSQFGDLEPPDSPYPVFEGPPPFSSDNRLFGYVATQKFYRTFPSGDPPDSVTVLASGTEVDFVVPATGTWALSLDYAMLAAGGTVDMDYDDVARVLLVTGAAFNVPGDIVATPLEIHRSQVSGGGCGGTLELPATDDPEPSTLASYNDCTGWEQLQFDLSEWAGDDLTLRFLVEEVGGDDGNPIALAFDNVQVVETFTREAPAGTAIPLAVTRPFLSHREPPAVVVFDTFEWTIAADADCTLSSTIDPNPTATCFSSGTYEVVATMTEDQDQIPPGVVEEPGVYYAFGTLIVRDSNTPPAVDEVAGPADPVQPGDPVTVRASFTDLDMGDAHTATFDWGDGTSTTLPVPAGARMATAVHAYAKPGVYPVEVAVADAGGEDTAQFDSVVVIDLNGGFVAGGGWLHSPAGGFRDHPELAGRLTVAFAARYHRHRSVPQGHTLVLRAFKFLFRAKSYKWLVIADGTAQYQGTGTVNGKGDYGFRVTAVDGGRRWHGEDHFTIKVWDRNDGDRVVYDNATPLGSGAPSTLLRGGAIVIHEKK